MHVCGYMCDVTNRYKCDVTDKYMWAYVIAYSVCIYVCGYKCDVTDTGWRRLIGSPKLQIIFHKKATKYKSLFRKMTYKDRGSFESLPPCTRLDEDSCVWHHAIQVMSHSTRLER